MAHLNVGSLPGAGENLPKPPPCVTDGEGCHSCRFWGRTTATTGFCRAPDEVLAAKGSVARSGWQTSFAYICPAHPRYVAQP